jgi:hypothetical protein
MSTPRRQGNQGLNREKLGALIHYVCEKATDPSVLGAIKLNKVLWYSDTINYLLTGKSITGETYIKRQHGPVPQHVIPAIKELVRNSKIARGRVDHFGYMKNEYISLVQVDKNIFTGGEVSVIDEAFEHVCMNHTAMSISEETHGVIWELAEIGQEIPMHTVFASMAGEVDEGDIAWAKQTLAAA